MNPKKITSVIGEDGKPVSVEVDLTPEELEKLNASIENEKRKREELYSVMKNIKNN